MEFLSIAHTDVGIQKNINQDALLLKEAKTQRGSALVAAVCDGMGVLAKGEVASAALVRAFSAWFEEELPFLLYEKGKIRKIPFKELRSSWMRLLEQMDRRIASYGAALHKTCGATASALLLTGNRYYAVNVGGSRIYLLDGMFKQLTKDQTFVQRELDAGRLTPQEAEDYSQRNVLLQCVGAGDGLAPDFFSGEFAPGNAFMLCSDGFCHMIAEEEFSELLAPERMTDEKAMLDAAVYCTELNKRRMEKDNISVILIKAR